MMNDQQGKPRFDQRRVEVIVHPGSTRSDEVNREFERSGPLFSGEQTGTFDRMAQPSSEGAPTGARREASLRRRFTIGKLIDGWWYLIAVLEVFLAARFFFELTGANRAAGFVRFVYGLSEPFAWPFNAIFAVPRHAQYVFDPNVVIAMVVYALVGAGVARLLAMLIEPPSSV